MLYDMDFLGQDEENLTVKHAAKQGFHDAVSLSVKYVGIGTVILIVLYFAGEKKINKIVGKVRKHL